MPPEVKGIMEDYPDLHPIPVLVDGKLTPPGKTWCDKELI